MLSHHVAATSLDFTLQIEKSCKYYAVILQIRIKVCFNLHKGSKNTWLTTLWQVYPFQFVKKFLKWCFISYSQWLNMYKQVRFKEYEQLQLLKHSKSTVYCGFTSNGMSLGYWFPELWLLQLQNYLTPAMPTSLNKGTEIFMETKFASDNLVFWGG